MQRGLENGSVFERPMILAAHATERISTMTKNEEPPSPYGAKPSPFLIGKDRHGHWVVRDQSGRRGGLFIGRVEALKYAMFENGKQPDAVIMVPGPLELDMSATPMPLRRVA
jgi:hypothetical protein